MEKEKKTQKSRTEGVKRRRKKVRGAGVWERGLQTKDIPTGAGQADWSSLVPQGARQTHHATSRLGGRPLTLLRQHLGKGIVASGTLLTSLLTLVASS